ncbi:RDD family protein [Streptomyces sp. TLI_185]|uniref:RDD family protein n=1 Tax=Streptomyces sp. TLI_185 TaxID=2485151 RepID=UPI000F5178C6|nr:RDD family protein [Streptomyces sp. TLI_185]RPF33951.1 putative RDD family membrane protein YckC [Streptomyces sp. TLI_185]
MSELVTGEAVALELRPARLPSRALAVLLDLVVAMVVYVVLTIALVAATASLDDAAQIAVSIATFVLVLVGGPIAVETLSHGRSLGKLACGLRVVRDDGGPIRFRHALVRGGIGVVEILLTFGVVACIASLVSARGRRLGDVFAGTLVVRERVPAVRTGFLPPPPPWLAGRFSELDLSAVPDGLWLAVRQYLSRMQQLDPQVGGAMAERLASDLAARTGTPVPQGVPPAAYLAAVVQERQAREARRAFANGSAVGSPAASGGPAGALRPAGAPGSYEPPAGFPPVTAPPAAHAAQTAAVGWQAEAPSQEAPAHETTQTAQSAQQDAPSSDRPAAGAGGTTESTGFVPPA